MQKENRIYHISQSYLIIECHFHRTSIPKNTLEKKICLPHCSLKLQMRSQMRQDCSGSYPKRRKADHSTWNGLHLGHSLRGSPPPLELCLPPECSCLGVASQLPRGHQERSNEAWTSRALFTLMTKV